MFTSMDLDKALFKAWKLTGLRTKRAVVEDALRTLVVCTGRRMSGP